MILYLTFGLLACLFFCGLEIKRVVNELDTKLNRLLCDKEKEG